MGLVYVHEIGVLIKT